MNLTNTTNTLLACKERTCHWILAAIERQVNCQKGGKFKERWKVSEAPSWLWLMINLCAKFFKFHLCIRLWCSTLIQILSLLLLSFSLTFSRSYLWCESDWWLKYCGKYLFGLLLCSDQAEIVRDGNRTGKTVCCVFCEFPETYFISNQSGYIFERYYSFLLQFNWIGISVTLHPDMKYTH